MALISENILQNMFDPMAIEQDQISAQEQGLNLQQNDELPVVSATTVDTTTTAAPAPLPGTIPGYKGSFEGKPQGATAKQKYRDKNLYKVNSKLLEDKFKEIDDIDVQYATTIFQTLQKLPVIDGKVVQLSEFPTIISSDKNKAKKLLEQARQFEDDPTLDPETSWNLAMMNYNSMMASGEVSALSERFNKSLKSVAIQADGAVPDPYTYEFNFHQALFDDKGNLRTKKEFDAVIAKRYKDIVSSGFISEQTPRVDAPRYLPAQRRYNNETQLEADQRELNRQLRENDPFLGSRSLYGQFQKSKQPGLSGGSPLYATNTREAMEADRRTYNIEQRIKNVVSSNSYEKVLDNLKTFYNKENSGGIYLGAEREGMITDQKGGDKQSPTGKFDFNMSNMKWKSKEGKIVFRPEVKEFLTIGALMTEPTSGARAAIGKVTTSVPSEGSTETKAVSELMRLVLEDVQVQNEKYTDAQKRHKSSFFGGTIEFQGIVEGKEKFHAFYVKLNDRYLKRDVYSGGDKKNPGIVKANPKLASEGFTIYIPAEKSAEFTNTGIKYAESTNISKVEALLNMKKDVNLFFNNAGNVQLTQLPDGNVSVGGYAVVFKPDQYIYDTIDLKPQVFSYNKTFDIDGYIRQEILPVLQFNLITNKQLKAGVDALKAVKNPSELQPKQ
jgi:hypothetical protein